MAAVFKVLPAFKEGVEKSADTTKKDHYDSLTKAVFMPASYDQDKDKAIKSIAFWKGADKFLWFLYIGIFIENVQISYNVF